MSWLATERSELGAERILDAAAQLFAEQGIGQPGMEDIARAAGCSRATVYRYFDNMDEPVMTAKDTSFQWGTIGVGTFDDTANFDNVVLRGSKAERRLR